MDNKTESALQFIQTNINQHDKDNMIAITSFGKDSMVLMDLIRQVDPTFKFVWIKPPYLPQETIELAELLKENWGYKLNLDIAESKHIQDKQFMHDVVEQPNLPKSNPEECCRIFKVEPIMRYVQEHNITAWFSGLRKTESQHRQHYLETWKQGKFTKLHPILDWEEWEIWRYIACHQLLTLPQYCNGYRSMGCEPCSFPGGNTERHGRWKDTVMVGLGCGVHCTPPYASEQEMLRILKESHKK